MPNAGGDRVDQGVYLLRRISRTQRKPDARPRLRRREPHRKQNVRRLNRAARARRTTRYRESTEVQRNYHRFAFDTVEPDIRGVRHAVYGRAVDPGSRYAGKNAGFK